MDEPEGKILNEEELKEYEETIRDVPIALCVGVAINVVQIKDQPMAITFMFDLAFDSGSTCMYALPPNVVKSLVEVGLPNALIAIEKLNAGALN